MLSLELLLALFLDIFLVWFLRTKNNVHPGNKKEVGQRLARWALKKTYIKNLVPSGPLPKEASFKEGKVTITFDYIAKGLNTSDGKMVLGFSLDGK